MEVNKPWSFSPDLFFFAGDGAGNSTEALELGVTV